MESKHTPTPWKVEMDDDMPIIYAHPYDRDISICEIGWDPLPDQARPIRDTGTAAGNAAFIVRACNAHDALVEACEAALRDVEDAIDDVEHEFGENAASDYRNTAAKLRAALALAGHPSGDTPSTQAGHAGDATDGGEA